MNHYVSQSEQAHQSYQPLGMGDVRGLKVETSLFPMGKHLFDAPTICIQFQHLLALDGVTDDKQVFTAAVFAADTLMTVCHEDTRGGKLCRKKIIQVNQQSYRVAQQMRVGPS